MFNASEAIKAQGEYCKENDVPYFAPGNGRCYKCHQNIYEPIIHERKDYKTGEVVASHTTGISVEEAGSELITGCPHCNRSYCD